MHKAMAACALLFSVPCAALAAAKPAELTPIIKASQPVGEASLRKLFMHVYDVQFWSDSGGWQLPPYALSITYEMGFTADELADRTHSEMQHVSSLPTRTLNAYTEELRRIYPAVTDGDRITALQLDDKTTAFYRNESPIGEIHGAEFGPAFFAIWLSPQSSEPELQSKLLPQQ